MTKGIPKYMEYHKKEPLENFNDTFWESFWKKKCKDKLKEIQERASKLILKNNL